MGAELFDCPLCGSAKSIEHGLCQVCLTGFALDTQVIPLPAIRTLPLPKPLKIEALQAD